MSLHFPEFGAGHLAKLPLHRNDGLEIVLVQAGTLRWQVESRVENVPPGSVFFTFPWELHGSAREWEPGHRWSFVVLHLPKVRAPRHDRRATWAWPAALGFQPVEGRALARDLLAAPQRHFPADEELRWLLPRLVTALQQRRSHGDIAAFSRLVLHGLQRAVRLGAAARPSGRTNTPLAGLCRNIEEDPGRPWTQAQLVRASGYARTRLHELFRTETGDSPAAFVLRARLVRARTLLRETDRTITEIAHACGFGSSQNFARAFRRLHGCTPRSLRAPASGSAGGGRGRWT